jgi:hypothetical protein
VIESVRWCQEEIVEVFSDKDGFHRFSFWREFADDDEFYDRVGLSVRGTETLDFEILTGDGGHVCPTQDVSEFMGIITFTMNTPDDYFRDIEMRFWQQESAVMALASAMVALELASSRVLSTAGA